MGRIEHGDVNTFYVHRFELHLCCPTPLGVWTIDLLVSFEVLAPRGIVLSGCFSCPVSAVGIKHSKVANIAADDAARRASLEFVVDISLPEIRGLHDMHVAVQDLETIFCHSSSLLPTGSRPNQR